MTYFLVALGFVVVIFVLVMGWTALDNRRYVKAKQGKPICGCDHHRAMHDPETNECHGENYEGDGEYRRCTCRQYVGPEPLPAYYAPEIDS